MGLPLPPLAWQLSLTSLCLRALGLPIPTMVERLSPMGLPLLPLAQRLSPTSLRRRVLGQG